MQPFRLERFFALYEFSTRYLLSSSDCEAMNIRELLAFDSGSAERFQDVWLGYTESSGHPELKQAIAGLYTGIAAGQVLVHAGAEEAIYLFARAMLSRGDHVVVLTPCYQSLTEVAAGVGCEVSEWNLRLGSRQSLGAATDSPGSVDQRWQADLDELKGLLRPTTRAVIVNTPHNPTGYLMPRETQAELVRLSQRHGFRIFFDEVYRGLEYRAADRLPAICELDDRAVSLGVLSKTYGLAGLRIGWIATRDSEILTKMAAYKDYTSICNSAPSEFLATLALRHASRLVDRNVAIIRANLDAMDAFAAASPEIFDWQRPDAGSVAFPRIRPEAFARSGHESGRATDSTRRVTIKTDSSGADPVLALCHRLASESGILLLPGSLYDSKWKDHVRVGLGRRAFANGLQALRS